MRVRAILHAGGVGALALMLAGCVSGGDLVQETSRGLARTAVDGAVRQYLPGVNVSPYTDCVINGANTTELLQLASSATAGAGGATQAWPIVRGITSRPETQSCLISAVQSNPLGVLG